MSGVGTAVFPTDIVGVISRDADLDLTDPLLGATDTLYPTGAAERGLELGSSFPRDNFRIGNDLRTVVMVHRTNTAVDAIRVLTAPAAPLLAASRFEIDDEGWTVAGTTSVGPIAEPGGNPGNRLRVTGAFTFFWIAPEKFKTALAAASGGRFAYDNRLLNDSFRKSVTVDLQLTGAGLVLTFDVPHRPIDTDWKRQTVPLRHDAGWRDQATGLAPTAPQFAAVLAAVEELRIRADFRNLSSTTAYLDNVELHAAPEPGRLVAPPGEFSVLAQNPDGSFTRFAKDGTRFDFDTDGKLIAETDRNGNTTTYAYDGAGNLESITDPANPSRSTTLAYDADGLSVITDVTGRLTQFDLDPGGDLLSVTAPDASTTRYAYDGDHRLTEEASERGFVTTNDYGFAGQYTGSGIPDGASIALDISRDLGLADLGIGLGTEANPAPFGRPENGIAELVDDNGNTTTIKLNEYGTPIEITDAIARTTTIVRDADNQIITITAPSDGELPGGGKPGQVVTQLDYDAQGNLTAQKEAAGTTLERQTLFQFEPLFNKVTKIVDAGGFETNFTYDANGNVTKRRDALDGDKIFTYNPQGLQSTQTDSNQNFTQFTYDATGNLVGVINAEDNQTAITRDIAGNVLTRAEGVGTPEERTTSFTYDLSNRSLTKTDGTGAVVSNLYDASGNVIEVTDAIGRTTVLKYDELDRLTEENHPALGVVRRTYDGNGNVETVVNQLNRTRSFQYDGANRRIKMIDPLLADRDFTYDAQDNRIAIRDARGNTTSFDFDLLDRNIKRINPLNAVWTFVYDSRDNLIQEVDPKDQVILRTFDGLSRQETEVTLLASGATEDVKTFTYDSVGNQLTAVDGDSSLAFTYDGINQLTAAETVAGPGTVQPPVTITYLSDAVGNRRQITDTEGGVTLRNYDDADRLVELRTPANEIIQFSYLSSGEIDEISYPNSIDADFIYGPGGRLSSLRVRPETL